MLRIDRRARRFDPIDEATLHDEKILERKDLQAMILNSWEAFVSELGFPTLHLIGQEIAPHESTKDRIDLLAFDDDKGQAVVIELKRHRNKLQLLQGLSYAAMVATWDSSRFLSEWQRLHKDGVPDDNLTNSLENLDDSHAPATILIAESFHPEIILTADWLTSQFDVDVHCFSVKVHKRGQDRIAQFQLEYPLRVLDDVYTTRGPSRKAPTPTHKQSWDDVKSWINYDWGRPIIDRAMQEKEGDPGRRRFAAMFPNDWGSYYLLIQKNEVRVVVYGRRKDDLKHWRKVLGSNAVRTWGTEESSTRGLFLTLSDEATAKKFFAEIKTRVPGLTTKTKTE